jgi:dihydroorotase
VTTYHIRDVSLLGAAPTDLLIRDGVVAAVGADAGAAGAEVIDAAGRPTC